MSGDPLVVETHVSVLVFLEDVVLKYKKPVRLPFLDFSTAELRQAACRAEVDANRRLSPDVYLGVADVALGGRTLDHAVVMRRLPAQRSLAAMVSRHAPGLDAHLRRLAATLADFHAGAPRSAAIADAGGPDAVAAVWRGCVDTLAGAGGVVPGDAVARLDALSARYLAGRRPLFDERVASGRVCDGHGDLLATDVFLLDDGPRVLDCVEFDPALRHVDVLADVAFLVMDLERLGAPAAAATFLHHYQEAAGEHFPPTLVDHYVAQRAAIRAEVACLRAAQCEGAAASAHAEEANVLLDLALDHLHRGRVVLCVVCGLPGTGKSTVAAALGDRLRWPVLRSDDLRRELVDPGAPTAPVEHRFGSGAYAPAVTARTYGAMLDRARVALGLGQPVVLDATFTDAAWQRAVEELGRDTASDVVVLECSAPPEVTVPRLRARRAEARDVSGADEAVAGAMAAAARRWPGAVVLDTAAGSPAHAAEAALAAVDGTPCGPAADATPPGPPVEPAGRPGPP